jgi:hypothetical protein
MKSGLASGIKNYPGLCRGRIYCLTAICSVSLASPSPSTHLIKAGAYWIAILYSPGLFTVNQSVTIPTAGRPTLF